jgi:hypothetical protein
MLINLILTNIVPDMTSIIKQLENSKYSTVLYVLGNSLQIDDDNQLPEYGGDQRFSDISENCDVIAAEYSSLYSKNIIFWPCPKLKVSEMNHRSSALIFK